MINIISVVIPTYNEEKNIATCLKSLNKQTISRQNFEIIVVDGHSTDKTVDIAKEFADKIIMQKTRWIAGARNDGIHAANYGIIACTDADCIVSECWLEEISKSLCKKNVAAVFGPNVPPRNNNIIFILFFSIINKSSALLNKLNIHLIFTSNFAFKKRPFLEAGGFSDISMLEDFEVGFRIKRKGIIAFNKNMVVTYNLRRYKKYGSIKLSFQILYNVLRILAGFNPDKKINYSKQNYE